MKSIALWLGTREWMDTRVDYFESLHLQLSRTSGEKVLLHHQIEAWAERDKSRKNPRYLVFAHVAKKMRDGGSSFAHALRPFIPSDEYLLLQSAEYNGDLAGTLRLVVDTIASKGSMRATVAEALASGFSGLATNWITAVLSGMYLWPEFLGLAPIQYWPLWSVPLLKFQLFAAEHWIVLTLGLLVWIPAYFVAAPRWTGRGRTFADKFPPFNVYKGLQAVSLLSALSALVQGGVHVRHALIQIAEITPPYLQYHVNRMVRKYDGSGENAIESIRTGLFSTAMQDRIEDAARGQSFDAVLKQVGSRSSALLHRLLKQQVGVIAAVITAINLSMLGYTTVVFIVAADEAQQKAINVEAGR